MHIKDRVKELRRVRASELVPNPKNWRTHPQGQQDALKGVLAEIGYADALLVRELTDGSLMLIDGHLRAEATPDALVPVLVLDVNEHEADQLLATLDPLAAMAKADAAKLDELLKTVEMSSAAVTDMLKDLALGAGLRLGDMIEDVPPEPADEAITQLGAIERAPGRLAARRFPKAVNRHHLNQLLAPHRLAGGRQNPGGGGEGTEIPRSSFGALPWLFARHRFAPYAFEPWPRTLRLTRDSYLHVATVSSLMRAVFLSLS